MLGRLHKPEVMDVCSKTFAGHDRATAQMNYTRSSQNPSTEREKTREVHLHQLMAAGGSDFSRDIATERPVPVGGPTHEVEPEREGARGEVGKKGMWWIWSWYGGSAAKSTHCSSWGPESDSQHPHRAHNPYVSCKNSRWPGELLSLACPGHHFFLFLRWNSLGTLVLLTRSWLKTVTVASVLSFKHKSPLTHRKHGLCNNPCSQALSDWQQSKCGRFLNTGMLDSVTFRSCVDFRRGQEISLCWGWGRGDNEAFTSLFCLVWRGQPYVSFPACRKKFSFIQFLGRSHLLH